MLIFYALMFLSVVAYTFWRIGFASGKRRGIEMTYYTMLNSIERDE